MRYRTQKVTRDVRGDGTILLQSGYPLAPVSDSTNEWLERWHAERPDSVFLAEREGEGWRHLTYGQALRQVQQLAAGLLAEGLGAETPILILSGNGIDHGLLALAAQYVGIPFVPVAEQYSLIPGAQAQLQYVLELIDPRLVYAVDGEAFASALALPQMAGRRRVVSRNATGDMTELSQLMRAPGPEVAAARAAVGPDTVAKILMTSGSTSNPKGVVTTQRMLCANQAQYVRALPFMDQRPPVLVDWLPWNHVFGGSNNFNQVLFHGGALYIDDGKPAPHLIGRSFENLKLVSPTIAYNVPVGFAQLRDRMQQDEELKQAYFRDLDMLFYAGASLPPDVWQDLSRMAREVRGADVMLTTCWGMTETAPACIFQHEPSAAPGMVGAPLPGVTVKMVPDEGDRYEIRVKGPNILPHYFRAPDKTAEAFDDEGFFLTGDAMTLADADNPNRGLKFAGRIAEDFKLATGIWVRATDLRLELLAALKPLALDVVITGDMRNEVGVLIFPTPATVPGLQDAAGFAVNADLMQDIAERLRRFSDPGRGSANRIARAAILTEPPSMAEGEVTAKGNLNFRKVQLRRQDLVQRLYEGSGHQGRITFE